MVHKVGADIAVEETSEDFEISELVAIGARPEFDPERLKTAWEHMIL